MKNIHLKRSRLALKKFKNGKGDRAYRKKLINESIDEVTEFMKESMPKYQRLSNGMVVNIHDMLA